MSNLMFTNPGLVCILFLLLITGSLHADDTLLCPGARKPVKIDADLGEWDMDSFIPVTVSASGQKPYWPDLDARFSVRWEAKRFCVAVIVDDDTVASPDRFTRPDNGDCVELFFDVDLDDYEQDYYSDDDFRILISPVTSTGFSAEQEVTDPSASPSMILLTRRHVKTLGPSYTKTDWLIRQGKNRLAASSSTENFTGLKVSSRLVKRGYIAEAAVAFDTLRFRPSPGKIIGFDIAIDDADSLEGRRRRVVFGGSGQLVSNPRLFERLRFSKPLPRGYHDPFVLIAVLISLLMIAAVIFIIRKFRQAADPRKPSPGSTA